MKTKFLMLLCLLGIQQLTAQNNKPVNQKNMNEYTLFFHYPVINYSDKQNEQLKQQWQALLKNWKERGIYISANVYQPNAIIVEQNNNKETDFSSEGNFVGAIVKIKAANKDEAITFTKETPVFSVNGSVEIREERPRPNKTVPVLFIDTFTVPDKAKTDFLERVKINRDLLKTLPGFIEDHAYEKTAGNSSFNYVTIAVWENEEAIENAKQQVMASYKKSGFNMPEFLKKNKIILHRAAYKEIEN
ncbi:antibiotic biosynthesis monooxygenase family protein [Flavobacterium beibuense]|uniref:Antibiotic biosynthesis monooxygenase n=1 Tax=Flavobacterium beibuense TaxID=657326 RepID=A0A444WHA7_9FLAO|nr:antibiotic biosynthesis monooxygenase family protein [Flavobacterium beibuense]RYJ45126.1 Antibiotic biosynthesis monooxygenase [Flavobacterium beibuense]